MADVKGSRRPPGRFIDVGGFRLHLYATGEGAPVVVFDAALAGSSISWTFVQPAVARFARACAYDRAGFGWSEGGPMPRTAGRIADELRVLLDRAGEPPPYLLVGHSFGGFVTRIFAAKYRADRARNWERIRLQNYAEITALGASSSTTRIRRALKRR